LLRSIGGALALLLIAPGCGGDDGGGPPAPLPVPACAAAATGSPDVAAPVLAYTLADRWHEGWLASPAVIDLDGDGGAELVVPRDELLVVWRIVGGAPVEAWRAATGGRIWASPVVADLVRAAPASRSRWRRAGRSTRSTPPARRCPASRSRGRTSCAASPPATSTATARSSWSR
jgi:hypothetical protein